nr:actinodefensin-associated protein B [uncultured Actinomyces sp.]
MAQRWRLADGMTLTHLENGGWTLADLRRLSVHELDEENGTLLDEALHSTSPVPLSPLIESAIKSGMIVDSSNITNPQEGLHE